MTLCCLQMFHVASFGGNCYTRSNRRCGAIIHGERSGAIGRLRQRERQYDSCVKSASARQKEDSSYLALMLYWLKWVWLASAHADSPATCDEVDNEQQHNRTAKRCKEHPDDVIDIYADQTK